MTTVDVITELLSRIDAAMTGIPKPPQASLYPSAVVTLTCIFAIKGVGNRPYDRWLACEWTACFPQWTEPFLAAPTVLGVIDTDGIELIHPIREGRSPRQIGKQGSSNHRWIVGGKLCWLRNTCGLVVASACQTAHVDDNAFQPLIRQIEEQMIGFSDTAFHAAVGDPANLKLC